MFDVPDLKRVYFLLWSLLFVVTAPLWSQKFQDFAQFSDSLFTQAVQESEIPGGAVAFVTTENSVFISGYGRADVKNQTPVNAETTLFQIGSVGKILTAIAVLQLVEQGSLNLDRDIRTYLHDFSLDLQFEHPLTLRHLLTHSAGFDERVIGYAARTKDGVQPLDRHLAERMPKQFQPPGTSISYSNYGYGLAGLVVEKVSGQRFTEYVQQNILAPLSMLRSTYDLPESRNEAGHDAVGYRPSQHGFAEQPIFYTHVKPAGGLYATAAEMTHLLQTLLNEGRFAGSEMLNKESIEQMFRRQFSNHPDMPGYTLGFEEQSISGTRAVGKGGATPGFVSVMLLLPERNAGLFVTCNSGSDDFIERFVQAFIARYRDQTQVDVEKQTEHRVAALSSFVGTYRNNRYNHHTVEDLPSLFRDHVYVEAGESGTLQLILNGKRHEYRRVKTTLFQNIRNPRDRIVFEKDSEGHITNLFLNKPFAGLSVPSTYEKLGLLSNPRVVNEFFLSLLPVVLISYILYPLVLGARLLLRIKWKFLFNAPAFHKLAHATGLMFAVLSLLYGFGYIARLNHLGLQLLFGVPENLRLLNAIPFIMIALLIPLSWSVWRIWREKTGGWPGRIYYSVYTSSAFVFLLFLQAWHFIGYAY